MNFSFDKCSQIPAPLEPYGDISGLGVVLGFVISAWLTVLLLIAYYFFAFDPEADPFRSAGGQNESTTYSHKPNPFDVLLAGFTRRLRSRKPFTGSTVENAFHKVRPSGPRSNSSNVYLPQSSKCILSLADAQLVTGFSILISGYWALKHGQGLSAYHWKMLVFLAWFSSVTHLSALTFLRGYFAVHPAGRLWRISMMFFLLVLLFVGFIPTGHFEFLGDKVTYAQFVDLGQALYPKDCDNFRLSGPLYYNGSRWSWGYPKIPTLTPKDCNISGEPVFQLDISFNGSNVVDLEYLWLENSTSWDGNAEVAILKESPAVCFFRSNMETSNDAFVSMVSSLLLLVYGYLIRTAKLFEGPSKIVSMRIQGGLDRGYETLMKSWERRLGRSKARGAVIVASICLPLQASVYCTLRVFIHLYTSMFAEVCFSH
ncbi:hypothetical protein CSOJ01_15836 [Colletotrichum sojae]|uniref:Uncharacterized protein n=1 Tax=Colletotrichum sojae TaxID=2175907 RepID=A0A8H6IM64_9PEZI|nr:hypothetical protein CSOJ01_15836 [Colletotrichum sojae]